MRRKVSGFQRSFELIVFEVSCILVLLMERLEALLEPIRHSPCLVEVVDMLSEQIEQERDRREQFYSEMTPEEKVEFIDGEIVMHSPARKVHLDISRRLFRLLGTFVDGHRLGHVFSEKCLCVFPRNDYEPDIVFFGKERGARLNAKTLKFPIPDFVVEILSDSTRERDRGVKFEDYAAHGVREYWIVDPEAETIEQYVLQSGQYELVGPSEDGRIVSRAIDGFSMPFAAAFLDAANVVALRQLLGSLGSLGSRVCPPRLWWERVSPPSLGLFFRAECGVV